MIRAKEHLLISSTYSSKISSGVSSLKRSSRASERTATEYFGLEIFTPGCLLKIKRILNFLVGFLARTERIVSLYRCFHDAANKEGVECGPFIRRPRFFKELSIAVS